MRYRQRSRYRARRGSARRGRAGNPRRVRRIGWRM